jgi:hypothetical protein
MMTRFTQALTNGSLLLLALSFSDGCGPRTGLAVEAGSNTGTSGASSMGEAGTASTGNAQTTGGSTSGASGAAGVMDDTIPAGWTGAQALTIQQSLCDAPRLSPPPFDVTETGGLLEGTLRCIEFREFQTLCGYAVDSGATARVLIQPCDMHPKNVPATDLTYVVTFTLPVRADRTTIEAYRRFDDYGATLPNVPGLLSTASEGPTGEWSSSADGGSD